MTANLYDCRLRLEAAIGVLQSLHYRLPCCDLEMQNTAAGIEMLLQDINEFLVKQPEAHVEFYEEKPAEEKPAVVANKVVRRSRSKSK
jgi:hypothetical protein